MRARVDDALCRGHGACVAICPEVFTLTDDGYAEAIDGPVPDAFTGAVADAVAACPEHAISAS